MYYNRFGNTVNYLVAMYPDQVAAFSQADIVALAQRQAKIDRPCCGPEVARRNAAINFPVPFIPSASTQRIGLKCCKGKYRW